MKQTRRRTALVVAATTVVMSACGGGDAVPTETTPAETTSAETMAGGSTDAPAAESIGETPAFGLVTPTEAAALATQAGITVIDVRTPEEYAEGHIDGATLLDIYEPTFADRIAALDPDGEYLVYCRSGNRSAQATALMSQLGFDRVYDLDGGVLAYGAAGLPLVK